MMCMEKLNLAYNGMAVPKNINFLVIEDDPAMGEIIVDELQMMGFEGQIKVSHSLDEAQKELRKDKYDYILCDWNLPDGEGIEMLEAARKSNKYSDTPFVLVTGNDSSADMRKSKYEGVSGYILKPWTPVDFKSKIFLGWMSEKAKSHELMRELVDKNKELSAKVEELEHEVIELNAKIKQLTSS